jgi:hypothetical protein
MGPSHDGTLVIKVQPARSRIRKSESSDRITLTMPPRGFVGVGGAYSLGSLLWLAFVGYLFAESIRRQNREFSVIVTVIGLPGVLGLVAGLTHAMKSWSLERDAMWLTLRRTGLWGSGMRRWPAADVGSFYLREALPGSDMTLRSRLVVGFRNGRSEDLIEDEDEEELQWTAAMLTEPRGTRKSASPLILAAGPERRRADPAIVPTTLACRTFEGGIEVSFLPLLRSKGLWWRLPLEALLGTIAIIGASVALDAVMRGGFPSAVPRIAVFGLLGWTGWRIWVLERSGLVQVLDGIVTVRQNQGKEPVEFGVGEVEFVQTYRMGRRTELQFLLRDKPKVRLMEGRPAQELEWAARFLRVAIKGRPAVPENASMKLDASAGDCQVCLEKMNSRVVYCAQCRTPHHEECWSYMGMCSTYGCREIRFERQA